MRTHSLAALTLLIAALAAWTGPTPLAAQEERDARQATAGEGVAQIPEARLVAVASAYAEIADIRNEMQAELAMSRNKTPEAFRQIHEASRARIAAVLEAHGLTEREYQDATYVISVDPEQRRRFDELLVEQRSRDTP